MDRLPALIAIALFATACDESAASGPVPGRVVSVAATQEDPAADFCDVAPATNAAPAMVWPEFASGTAPNAGTGARWVNVWATWCAPCVEELPRLLEWRDRLAADDVALDLVFVSADGSDEAVAAFRAEHPGLPEGPRVANPAAIAQWAPRVGLDGGATLPIHLLLDARGRVRCARTGGVQERDFRTVRQLIDRL